MRRRLACLALAAATAVLLTWPLVLHPTTRLLDDGTLDGFGFTWTLWWDRHALAAQLRAPRSPGFPHDDPSAT